MLFTAETDLISQESGNTYMFFLIIMQNVKLILMILYL